MLLSEGFRDTYAEARMIDIAMVCCCVTAPALGNTRVPTCTWDPLNVLNSRAQRDCLASISRPNAQLYVSRRRLGRSVGESAHPHPHPGSQPFFLCNSIDLAGIKGTSVGSSPDLPSLSSCLSISFFCHCHHDYHSKAWEEAGEECGEFSGLPRLASWLSAFFLSLFL